jgi:hypothetical protein
MGGYSSTYDGKQVEHILRNASCIKTTAVVANQWYAYVLGDDMSENIGSFSGTFSFQAKFTDESVEQLTIHVAATYDTSRSHAANVKILNHTTNGDEFKMTALGFDCNETVAVEAGKIYSSAIKVEGDFLELLLTGSNLINCTLADLSASTGGTRQWAQLNLLV